MQARVIPSLLVRDLAETLAFYRTLGFERTGLHPRDAGESEATWAEVRREGAVVQLYVDPPVGTPDAPVCSGTLYVVPTDVTALAEELAGRVELVWGPEVMEYGWRELAVRDPNGYLLAFAEPVA